MSPAHTSQGPAQSATAAKSASSNRRHQFSSFILFVSVVIFVNLCPFESQRGQPERVYRHDSELLRMGASEPSAGGQQPSCWWQQQEQAERQQQQQDGRSYVARCVDFLRLVFTLPRPLHGSVLGRPRTAATRFMQADAKLLGKVAKAWYIKKKLKKLKKKLKKHTIAVPVFTAIPIYEHSYYPQPHVGHHGGGGGGGLHHAGSYYEPTVVAAEAAAAGKQVGAIAASASSLHHAMVPYRMAGHRHALHYGAHYAPHSPAIINAYAPSPPLFVDEAAGLYGQYGNHYGRYDGGYHYW